MSRSFRTTVDPSCAAVSVISPRLSVYFAALVEKVAHNLLQPRGIGQYQKRTGREVDRQFVLFGGHQRPDRFGRAGHYLAEIDDGELELDLAGADP